MCNTSDQTSIGQTIAKFIHLEDLSYFNSCECFPQADCQGSYADHDTCKKNIKQDSYGNNLYDHDHKKEKKIQERPHKNIKTRHNDQLSVNVNI